MRILLSNITKPLYKELDSMYNHRKEEENLVSLNNNMINRLRSIIRDWELKEHERITKIQALTKE